MNTKLLKQKILDLAIRGKLTQQLKTDGTTADLLKEISSTCHSGAKRSGAIESKKSKNKGVMSEAQSAKSKDLKQIIPLNKSEAPFEIPENWEWVKLGDIAYIASGSTPSKDCFVENGVPYLKMYNLRNQQIDFEYKPQYIKGETHEGKLARSKAKPGDVIMNIVGPPLGKVALVPESLPECNFNQAAVLIRAHFCTNLMNQYIRYFLLQMDEINAINTKGTAGQENISLTQTQNMRLPLPPLAEQQRIVAKIEEAFAEIDAIEKNKELLKTHIKQTRQKILDLAIHGKLVPQNKTDEPASVLLERITRDNPHYEKLEDEPFEVPDNWVWCKLGDLFFHTTGKALKKANSTGIQKNYITTSNLYWNEFDLSEVRSMYFTEDELDKCTAQKGDLLLCNGGDVGRAAIWNFDYDICFQNHISRLRPKIDALNNAFYLYVIRYNKEKGNLNGRGVGISSLSANDLLSLIVPLPPLAEQKRIVNKIEEIFASLDEISLHLV